MDSEQASIREIQEAFPEKVRPAYTTIQTTVYRLEAKKAVRRVKKVGNFHVFEAAVSRNAAQRKLIDDLLALFGGRTQPVMAHLIESGKLTLEDVKEAEKTLRKLARKDNITMIPKYLSAMWSAVAPALGNHLWQSTLFAVMAGLLTLLLRKNHARTRYWLWLTASAKFLIPFSLLVSIGNRLSWLRDSAGTKAGLYFAMEELSQPFTQTIVPTIPRVSPSATPLHLLPALLTAVWLCGFVLILCVWCLRWRRVSAAMREASPLQRGREVEALRRLENLGGVPKRIEHTSLPRFVGTGDLRYSSAGFAVAGRDLSTSCRCPPRSHSRARALARAPSRQSFRCDSHGGGIPLLVPSFGLVVGNAAGRGARTCL